MQNPTVLIADDDPHVVAAMRTRLTHAGYGVVECRDGLGVLAKSRVVRPDVLILDHEMPLGAGCSLVGAIREHSRAPIVFVSGHDRETFRETVEKVADVYYLSKPIEFDKLLGLLRSLLAGGDSDDDIEERVADAIMRS